MKGDRKCKVMGQWWWTGFSPDVSPSLALLLLWCSDGTSILYPPCREITACLEMVAQGWEVTQQHGAWDCCQILRSADCNQVRGKGRDEKFEDPTRPTQKQFYCWVKGLCLTVSGGVGSLRAVRRVPVELWCWRRDPAGGSWVQWGLLHGALPWGGPLWFSIITLLPSSSTWEVFMGPASYVAGPGSRVSGAVMFCFG